MVAMEVSPIRGIIAMLSVYKLHDFSWSIFTCKFEP